MDPDSCSAPASESHATAAGRRWAHRAITSHPGEKTHRAECLGVKKTHLQQQSTHTHSNTTLCIKHPQTRVHSRKEIWPTKERQCGPVNIHFLLLLLMKTYERCKAGRKSEDTRAAAAPSGNSLVRAIKTQAGRKFSVCRILECYELWETLLEKGEGKINGASALSTVSRGLIKASRLILTHN